MCQIGHQRLRKLVGAGGVLSAFDPMEQGIDLIGRFSLHETGNALQISAAAADKFYVVDLVVVTDIEYDLFRACTFG